MELTAYTFSGFSKQTKKEYDIVVGIDFGTTYSGVAYAIIGESNDKGNAIIGDISKWPGIRAYSQTPTRSAYSNGKLIKWGGFGRVAESIKTISLFKLHLDETKKDLIPELPNGVDIEQAISDYLKAIFEHTRMLLESHFRKAIDTNKLRFCLTVPVVWTEKAKSIMRDAVIRAGLISKEDPQDRLLLVSEPEAAALYCETFLDEYNLKPGQNFLICDAGGGTVDLAVYRISVDKKGKNSLMEEVVGDGATCGSTTLDVRFRRFVSDNIKLLFKDEKPLTDRELDSIVYLFAEETKFQVRHPSNPDYDEDNFIVTLPDRFDESKNDSNWGKVFVTDSYLHIHPEIMLSVIFDPVINEVLRVIDTQLRRIDRRLDAIFLVGGFGQSTYLLHRIKDEFANDVALICAPARGAMAIVRGAVLMGLNPQFVKQRVIHRTYGYECSLKFDKALDPERLRKISKHGEAYCIKRFKSYVLKGEVKDVDYYTYTSFKCYYNKNPVLQLFAYDGSLDQLPRYTTDDKVEKVAEFEIILPNIPGKGPSNTVVINVKFYLYQTEIKLEVEIENHKNVYTGSYKNMDYTPISEIFLGKVSKVWTFLKV